MTTDEGAAARRRAAGSWPSTSAARSTSSARSRSSSASRRSFPAAVALGYGEPPWPFLARGRDRGRPARSVERATRGEQRGSGARGIPRRLPDLARRGRLRGAALPPLGRAATRPPARRLLRGDVGLHDDGRQRAHGRRGALALAPALAAAHRGSAGSGSSCSRSPCSRGCGSAGGSCSSRRCRARRSRAQHADPRHRAAALDALRRSHASLMSRSSPASAGRPRRRDDPLRGGRARLRDDPDRRLLTDARSLELRGRVPVEIVVFMVAGRGQLRPHLPRDRPAAARAFGRDEEFRLYVGVLALGSIIARRSSSGEEDRRRRGGDPQPSSRRSRS